MDKLCQELRQAYTEHQTQIMREAQQENLAAIYQTPKPPTQNSNFENLVKKSLELLSNLPQTQRFQLEACLTSLDQLVPQTKSLDQHYAYALFRLPKHLHHEFQTKLKPQNLRKLKSLFTHPIPCHDFKKGFRHTLDVLHTIAQSDMTQVDQVYIEFYLNVFTSLLPKYPTCFSHKDLDVLKNIVRSPI